MAKQRFSISLDEEHAAQIKATAAMLGEDVSAFMTKAALEAVKREQRRREIFRDIDQQIAAAEAGAPADEQAAPEPVTDPQIAEFWDDVFRSSGRGAA